MFLEGRAIHPDYSYVLQPLLGGAGAAGPGLPLPALASTLEIKEGGPWGLFQIQTFGMIVPQITNGERQQFLDIRRTISKK